MNLYQTIAKRIKDLRTSRGLTQEALAEKLGVQLRTVARYESGKSSINLMTLNKLAKIFNVGWDYFFRPYTDKSENTNTKLIETIEYLNKDNQNTLYKIASELHKAQIH